MDVITIACAIYMAFVPNEADDSPTRNWNTPDRNLYEDVLVSDIVPDHDPWHIACGDYIDDRIGMD